MAKGEYILIPPMGGVTFSKRGSGKIKFPFLSYQRGGGSFYPPLEAQVRRTPPLKRLYFLLYKEDGHSC